ncbi:MAG: autotransporter domain-containing protein [Alphaproteobacteria bacterium]|nr:autotransporter domain-containing protein [Alphaproteobacteria bacterium]
MLKLSRTGIGLLTAQYRSVLKKCLILNMCAAGCFVSVNAANATDYDINKIYDSTDAAVSAKLQGEMGTDIDAQAASPTLQGILIHGDMTQELVSRDEAGGTYGSGYKYWVTNKGIIGVGYQKNGGIPSPASDTVISNKHNAGATDITFGGGAIQNHNAKQEEGGNVALDSLMIVTNATFSNNSATDFAYAGADSLSVGGAIFNISSYEDPVPIISQILPDITNNTITGSTFTGNFAMNFIQASGGAIYNDAFTGLGPGGVGTAAHIGVINSSGNTFTGNHVGNEDFYNADNVVKTYILGTTGSIDQSLMTTWKNSDEYAATGNGGLTKYASGGALYNGGKYNAAGDNFTSNYAIGKYAMGGAIFNADTYVLDQQNIIPEYNLSGTSEFASNYVSSTELADHEYDGLTGGKAIGGAIYNGGKLLMADDGGTRTFSENYASARDTALGGAVYNIGHMEIYDATFTNNSARWKNVSDTTFTGGGALASVIDNADYSTTVYDSTFTGNVVNAISSGLGGAIYNHNNLAETKIIDSSLTNNAIEVTEIAGRTIHAFGGAVYNDGEANKISRFTLQAQTADVNVSNNGINVTTSASGSIKEYYGGAFFNGNYGQMTIESVGADKTLSIMNNHADDGGAIYNKADGSSVTVSGVSYSTYLLINGVSGNIEIANNQASNNGGALYNNTWNNGLIGTATISATNGSSVSFASNKAVNGNGGAIYNINGSDIEFRLGNGTIAISSNSANVNGGGIFNEGSTIEISNAGTMGSGDVAALNIRNNTAQRGAGIYNVAKSGAEGFISGNLSGNTTIMFDGNTASAGTGGAIYNDSTSGISLNLRDTAKIVFNTTSDDVYNEGNITITGDSSAPNVPSDSAMQTAAINTEATQVVLNSTFGGTGNYNISNTQLNLGTTGYIDEDPVMNLSNNVVNMASNSHIYLTSADTLNNNNFDLATDAMLRYTDTVTTDNSFYLANTIKNAGTVAYAAAEGDTDIRIAHAVVNSGVVSAADGLLTNVHIDTLTSKEGNEIIVNLDNPNLKADVLTIDHRIYNETDTPTNITFVDMNNAAIGDVTLGEEDRIYFAQTQLDQDLSQYGFSVNAQNTDYEIKVGYEENGSIYDWFLYREAAPVPPEPDYLDPEDLAYIDLPRSAVEQTRGIIFDVTRTNRGQCNCYADNCRYHECRYESSPDKYRLWARPSYRSGTFDKPVETDFKLKGIEFGLDYQPTHSDMIGIFGSYRDGKYENDGGKEGKKFYSPYGGSELTLKSMLGGLYYRKYYGNLYFLGAGYFGKIKADMKADNKVKASTDGINIGAQAELGYDIRTSKRSLLTPSIRATYDHIKFDDVDDSNGKKAEFGTINDVELEAALKFEYQFNNEYELPTTGYIKPSVIQTIENGGKVEIDGVEYDDTLDNETLGRIEVGADAEIIEHFSLGAFGNYTFGSDYKAWGVGGNVRIVW